MYPSFEKTHSRVSPIIQANIGIAHGYDLQLLAEGVETGDQVKILAELGCDEMQGYFFSKPLSAEDAENLLFDPGK